MLDGSYGGSTSSATDDEATWATAQTNHIPFDSGGVYDWATSSNHGHSGFGENDPGVSPENLTVGSEAYLVGPSGQPYHSVFGQGSSS